MDMHHNRFGYIITETELLMFRRRNENTLGQLYFSPAIKFSAGINELNPLMVLWYFHVKYAVTGQKCCLRSFIHNYVFKGDSKAAGGSDGNSAPDSDSNREIYSANC